MHDVTAGFHTLKIFFAHLKKQTAIHVKEVTVIFLCKINSFLAVYNDWNSHNQKCKSPMNALLEGNDNGFNGFLVIQENQLWY